MGDLSASCVLPANSELTVLVLGESGVGKSTLVQAFATARDPGDAVSFTHTRPLRVADCRRRRSATWRSRARRNVAW